MITPYQVAKICHQANKALCEAQDDFSQVDFEQAPDWQKESAIKGVMFCLENPNSPARANHESWHTQKIQDGWKYGPVKNADLKEHPCMVSFEELPAMQQAKDSLFKAIVGSLDDVIVLAQVS